MEHPVYVIQKECFDYEQDSYNGELMFDFRNLEIVEVVIKQTWKKMMP